MKLLVIDANLVYSAIRNPKSKIAQFIHRVKPVEVELFAPTYLKAEIEQHLPKLSSSIQTSIEELKVQTELITANITFVDDAKISFSTIIKALRLVRDIDPDDVLYVALNDQLDGILFTGDKKLYQGLIAKGYNRVINFKTLLIELDVLDKF